MNRLLIFLLLCFIAVCAGVYISLPANEFSIGTFSVESPFAAVEEHPAIKDRIRFVGDIMLARNVENLMDAYGYYYPFTTLPQNPATAYIVGNFEATIPVEHVPTQSMQFSFSVDPQYLRGLREYGFTHLGLANNHAYDFGVDDYKNATMHIGQNDLAWFGSPESLATSSVSVITLGTSTVAVVGVYAVDQAPAVADIAQVFKYASDISDLQVAYVHFGDEYKLVHNGTQEHLAHLFIDAGADAVIGHHPHVVQDIELYKNAPIFYSLGNFIFDQYFSEEVQTGLMLEMSVADQKLNFTLLPITSIGSRSVPRLMSAYEQDEMLKTLAKKSDTELNEMILSGVLSVALQAF
jgi:poly-gamma-glutamate synthesis protein (capsule biosynthesis protein)